MTSQSSRIEPGPHEPALIAFYLPQFHPIPENDAWWGPGFTEWRNVVRGRPLYSGHYQPHIPGELGFYDLRMPEIREAQAALAQAHGIRGFCYYHYWFNGRRILERPFDDVLASGSPKFPFCLCWANEPWTRNWDGGNREILIAQRHSLEDDRAHIRWLIRAFEDERYIRIGDRPVFFVYNITALEDSSATTSMWRDECAKAGVEQPYIVRFDTFGHSGDPGADGCDASAEFLPHGVVEALQDAGIEPIDDEHQVGNLIFRYQDMVDLQLAKPLPPWTHYQCVVPGWDNTPRKPQGAAHVFIGSTPDEYERWLRGTVAKARAARHEFVLINAWNEWAEGTHLEPDLEFGRGYLEATARVAGADPSQFDLDGIHRGRVVQRNEKSVDMAPAELQAMYDVLRSSSAREIETLQREIERLERALESLTVGRDGDPDEPTQPLTVVSIPTADGRLRRMPVAGRAVRTLSILRSDWRNL